MVTSRIKVNEKVVKLMFPMVEVYSNLDLALSPDLCQDQILRLCHDQL